MVASELRQVSVLVLAWSALTPNLPPIRATKPTGDVCVLVPSPGHDTSSELHADIDRHDDELLRVPSKYLVVQVNYNDPNFPITPSLAGDS